jgi:hypothetical protein
MTVSFSVISVTRPRVPSEPTKRFVKLYPADDLLGRGQNACSFDPSQDSYRGRRRVLMTVPSANTTVRLITQSFMVPYLTAFVPLLSRQLSCRRAEIETRLQLVPTIPPILACNSQ